MDSSPGSLFRRALSEERPLQIVGTINAYVARMAQRIGFKALYLSGAGVANASYGLPDLAMTTLNNVLEETSRITASVDLPLLVDIDTGWGHPLLIRRAIRLLERAGAAGVHIEDQVAAKRCGHRPGKKIVATDEMIERIRGAVEGKSNPDFVVMARSDAFALEGLDAIIQRAKAYRDAGADMLFLEALHTLDQYKAIKQAVQIPILANITEFGLTPLFTLEELRSVGVDMVLYPLTIMRTMNLAAEKALQELRTKGTQKNFLDRMQTREELYNYLDYHTYEDKL